MTRTCEIPAHFVALAGDWYSGQFDLLYAVASTGGLERGTRRPRNDAGDPMSDLEWDADLWGGLAADIAYARRMAERTQHADATELAAFEAFADAEYERLAALVEQESAR